MCDSRDPRGRDGHGHGPMMHGQHAHGPLMHDQHVHGAQPPMPEACDCDSDEADDPVEGLQDFMLDVTDEAFHDLVMDATKSALKKKLGKKLDQLAGVVVDYYLKTREQELKEMELDDAFDASFREVLSDE